MRRTVIDFYLNKGNNYQLLSIVECSFAGFAGKNFGTPVNCCFVGLTYVETIENHH